MTPAAFFRYAKFAMLAAATWLAWAALLVIVSWLLVQSQVQEKYDYYQALANYSFNQEGKRVAILFMGESALLRGVKPKVIEDAVGEPVRSIPLYASSGTAVYDTLLDQYLAHNPPPQLVIFYLSVAAPALEAEHSFEKSWALLRFGGPVTALANGVSLTDMVRTDGRVIKEPLTASSKDRAQAVELPSNLAQNNGYAATETPPLANCTLDSRTQFANFSSGGLDNVEWDITAPLRRKYGARGIKVLVYVAPLPHCDVSYGLFRSKYKFALNKLIQLPDNYFSDGTHMTSLGAENNSRRMGAEMRSLLTGAAGSLPPR